MSLILTVHQILNLASRWAEKPWNNVIHQCESRGEGVQLHSESFISIFSFCVWFPSVPPSSRTFRVPAVRSKATPQQQQLLRFGGFVLINRLVWSRLCFISSGLFPFLVFVFIPPSSAPVVNAVSALLLPDRRRSKTPASTWSASCRRWRASRGTSTRERRAWRRGCAISWTQVPRAQLHWKNCFGKLSVRTHVHTPVHTCVFPWENLWSPPLPPRLSLECCST